MPVRDEWMKVGRRLITPDGRGEPKTRLSGGLFEVRLDNSVAGSAYHTYSPEQIALDTDFVAIRLINLGDEWNPVTSAVNYPNWLEVRGATVNAPFAENETLLGFNFDTREVICNRRLPDEPRYQIVSAYYDLVTTNEVKMFSAEDLNDAEAAWSQIANLSGVTGHIWLAVFFDLKERRVLHWARFSTIEVLDCE